MAAYLPTDPLFYRQKHLLNPTSGQIDINVTTAWADWRGRDVTVAVFDTGMELDHPDYADALRTDIDFDYYYYDEDPSPLISGRRHGTPVLGIVGARMDNGEGGVGVAPEVDLLPYLRAGDSIMDDALLDAAGLGDGYPNRNGVWEGADVVSMSYGWSGSDTFRWDVHIANQLSAMERASAEGRGGLGMVHVKSAGNDRKWANHSTREETTSEALDGAAWTITAAAARYDGWISRYSSPGASVLVTAPVDTVGNGWGVYTTDRAGSLGYAGGSYTNFSGTSAAAPMIAGVVALMLEANPGLGWRDVQSILAASARHAGSAVDGRANAGAPSGGAFEQATADEVRSWTWNGAQTWNGGAMHVSNDYGYGIVDATAAVRLAETWTDTSTTANRAEASGSAAVPAGLLVEAADHARHRILITEDIRVEHVALDLTARVDRMKDLELHLRSPSGTLIQLTADTGGDGVLVGTWSFGAQSFRGEDAAGEWSVLIRDDALNGSMIDVQGLTLRVWGADAQVGGERFVFTEAYDGLVAAGTHGTLIAGGEAADEINASAVAADAVLDLAAGVGRIDGVDVVLVSIERAIAGDGDDLLVAGAATKLLDGGRGADTLTGSDAADLWMIGAQGDDTVLDGVGDGGVILGAGDDTLVLGGGFDIVLGGDGIDLVDARALAGLGHAFHLAGDVWWDGQGARREFSGIERLILGDGADTVWAGRGATSVDAGGGDDVLHDWDPDVAPDVWIGGAGRDVLVFHGDRPNDEVADMAAGEVRRDGVVVDVFSGIEEIRVAHAMAVRGTEGDDVIEAFGDWWRNDLAGLGGNDTLLGGGGSDSISGGDGDDFIDGGAHGDTIDAGDGADTVLGGGGPDQVWLGEGDDLLIVGDVLLSARGGAGADTHDLRAAPAHDWYVHLWAGVWWDETGRWLPLEGFETVLGGAGDETFRAGHGGEVVLAGAGDDTLIDMGPRTAEGVWDGGAGRDTLIYEAWLEPGVVIDLAGEALLSWSGAQIDTIRGVEELRFYGWAEVKGSWRDETIVNLDRGPNMLSGGDGADLLDGGGNDSLSGGAGRDTLIGGTGVDELRGGSGGDRFVMRPGFGIDSVMDLDPLDAVLLEGFGLAATSFADLTSAVAEGGGDAVLHLGGGDALRFVGASLDMLEAVDWIFA